MFLLLCLEILLSAEGLGLLEEGSLNLGPPGSTETLLTLETQSQQLPMKCLKGHLYQILSYKGLKIIEEECMVGFESERDCISAVEQCLLDKAAQLHT